MAILLKCGAIFLHVPKTGGNWVSEVLEDQDLVFANVGGRHSGPDQLAPFEALFRASHRYGKPNRPFYRFCFVRHPLRWYESWFQMMRRIDWIAWPDEAPYWYPPVLLNGLRAPDLASFVEQVLAVRPAFVAQMYAWYTSRGVHFVGRQESLADDLAEVLRRLGVRFDEGRLRRRAPANVGNAATSALPPALLLRLEEAEFWAYRHFGYPTEIFAPDATTPRTPDAADPEVALRAALPLPRPFVQVGERGWSAALPQLQPHADDAVDPYRSMLVLYADGRPLGPSHALHDDVKRAGGGRYSHWQSYVLFSTPDGRDPNTDGRRYDVALRHTLGATADHLRIEPYPEAPAAGGDANAT